MLTIVIPTKGRETLEEAIESTLPVVQDGYGCDVLVIADTYGPMLRDVQKIVSQYPGVRYAEFNAGYNDWGYPQLKQAYLRGDCEEFIMNIGDDDVMVPGVIPRIIHIIERNGVQPYLFQAELHPSSHRGNRVPVVLWNDEDRSIERKKVTGQNLIVPNYSDMMGNMTDDFEFIRQTIEKWNGAVTWVPVVTCRCY